MKLKIGCMDSRLPGYVHLDIEPGAEPDIIGDACRLPLQDRSVSEIVCENVLEHIQDTLAVMRECHRVLKPEGQMKIVVPHFHNPGFRSTPDHVRGFTYTTFNQFWQDAHKGYPKFSCTKRRLIMQSRLLQPLADRWPLKMEYLFWLFHPDRIEVELRAIK